MLVTLLDAIYQTPPGLVASGVMRACLGGPWACLLCVTVAQRVVRGSKQLVEDEELGGRWVCLPF